MCVFEQQILSKSEPPQGTRQRVRLGRTVADDLLLGAREVYEALCAPASIPRHRTLDQRAESLPSNAGDKSTPVSFFGFQSLCLSVSSIESP